MLRTQPSLPIAGTLASDDEDSESGDDLNDAPFSNNIVAFPVLAGTQAVLGPPAAPIELDAPLPVYEDRGGAPGGLPAPQGGQNEQPLSAPGPAPHSVSAHPDPALERFAPQSTGAHAPLGLAGRPLGANWWEGGGVAEATLNQGRPTPALPPPVVSGPPPGPAFTDLHHEIVAFAHRASPSQVRSNGVRGRGRRAAIEDKKELFPLAFIFLTLSLHPSTSGRGPHRPGRRLRHPSLSDSPVADLPDHPVRVPSHGPRPPRLRPGHCHPGRVGRTGKPGVRLFLGPAPRPGRPSARPAQGHAQGQPGGG